ncbi:hypothetical protein CBW65_04470 [Tumebacillus avium]|uniref:Uncharacterized protein n=1 Tax=Tumebacillus avium TaxID=1903704 RepID=A0A1Y0IM17_9BACL|nr:hypothetical protein [Tumebacillus avium]ARU60403.1 hypothetical protein CBW65_04470 [Tumebacillus avium]
MSIRKFIIPITLLLLVAVLSMGYTSFRVYKNNEGITLSEAFHLGFERAKAWDSNAQLVDLASVDDWQGGSKGKDGKRRHWNFIFCVPGKPQSLILTLHDQEFVYSKPGHDTFTEFITEAELQIDSPAALKAAPKKQLQPKVQGESEGYHFILLKHKGKSMIIVDGQDSGSNTKKLYIDSASGRIIEL